MEDVINFVQAFKGLEERIDEFINEDSFLEYLEGSEAVVEGGAYVWSKLKPAEISKQDHINSDYMSLAEEVRNVLTNEHSPHIEKFERSCAIVLNYIRQDTLLWVPGLKNVIENIKSELDLQQFFIELTR
ncbi:hypothetical protein C173_27150 [Paenibacillus sp. FSL R7-277]|uniref:hypothetical protein n=1 Tax=Paenibacillus sp. FSL R7-277 TaxID=1227352 RepID=UPI0003E20288|nr:hypothetical protein [Paenibacillus sp. FSL R7-277]ETT60963.1 hypothetical protein C173_27150 [Paenibacillus sp. FSL R7-277]